MKQADVYLYGQILMTTSILLRDEWPQADSYGEIKTKYRLSGGETGTCATVLDALGCSVRMEGTWLGRSTRDDLLAFYRGKNVDLSLATYDETFDGLEDIVLIAGDTRTCLGMFGQFEDEHGYRWNHPTIDHLEGCKVAGVDPYFKGAGEEVGKLCVEAGLPYVTIDSRHDSYLNRHAAINAVSHEFLDQNYPNENREDVFRRYVENTDGLVIFTLGSKQTLYGRRGQAPKTFVPYPVKVQSTLGAGDTFKAGCVYALLHGMADDEAVAFASACAGAAIMQFPIPLHPPTLERIAAVQALRK